MPSTVANRPPASGSAWRARAALTVATAVLLMTAVGVAQADNPNTGSSQGSTSGNFNVNVPGSSSGGSGGSGSSKGVAYDPNARVCIYTTVYNTSPYRIAQPPAGQTAADGHSVTEICGPASSIRNATGSDPMANCSACGAVFGIWAKNPTPSPAQIAQAAFANLGLQRPDIHTNPDTSDSSRHLVVGLPTWLWIDGKKDGYSVVQQGIKIIAHQKVAWYADGAQISAAECGDSAGVAYVPGTTDPRAKPPCGHTFNGAGAHSLKAVVTWTGSFVGGGTSGPIAGPAIMFTTVKAVNVEEVQTVNR